MNNYKYKTKFETKVKPVEPVKPIPIPKSLYPENEGLLDSLLFVLMMISFLIFIFFEIL